MHSYIKKDSKSFTSLFINFKRINFHIGYYDKKSEYNLFYKGKLLT